MKIVQHLAPDIPTAALIVNFETVEELLAVPFVAEYRGAAAHFTRFSLTLLGTLMCEYNLSSVVVGYVIGAIPVALREALPLWPPTHADIDR